MDRSAVKKSRTQQWEPTIVFNDLYRNFSPKPIHNAEIGLHGNFGTVCQDGFSFHQ